MRILLVGSFDLLHVGHLDVIRRAAERGPLGLGVLSDEAVVHLTGSAPSAPAPERAKIAGHVSGVTAVTVTGPATGWSLPPHDVLYVDPTLTGDLPWSWARPLGSARWEGQPALAQVRAAAAASDVSVA